MSKRGTVQAVTAVPPGITGVSTQATAGAGTLTAANGQIFTFSTPMETVIIQSSPNYTGNLYVAFNGSQADDDSHKYDVIVPPGEHRLSPLGLVVTQVAIFANVAATYGTSFVVKGW